MHLQLPKDTFSVFSAEGLEKIGSQGQNLVKNSMLHLKQSGIIKWGLMSNVPTFLSGKTFISKISLYEYL